MKNKLAFTAFLDKDGRFWTKKPKEGDSREVKFAVIRPGQRAQIKGQEIYNLTFTKLFKAGTLVKPELDRELKKRDLWDDNKQADLDKLSAAILAGENKLLKGGMSKKEGRAIALQMIKDRRELMRMNSDRNWLERNTAESQAEDARFNYYISACLVYDEDFEGCKAGETYYKSYEDYMERSDNDNLGNIAGNHLMELQFDMVEIQKNLAEYKFLLQYKFVDDKLRLINDKGHLIDEDGRLVDEDGRFINKKGEFVDRKGNRVNDDGTPMVEFAGFTD